MPESVTISRQIDAHGNVVSETNGRGFVTSYAYDDLNRLISITTAKTSDADVSIVHSFTSRTRTLTRGDFTEQSTFDGFGRVISKTAGNITVTTDYDAVGRTLFESYPSSSAGTDGTELAYDALGRVIRSEHTVDGSTVEYTYLPDNRRLMVDERLNQTLEYFRSFGDPDQQDLVRTDSPEGVITTIDRYFRGDIRSISQEGGGSQLTRIYDLDNRYYPLQEDNPERPPHNFVFDSVGNQTLSRVGAGTANNISYQYDDLNRLTLVDFPSGGSSDVVSSADESRSYDPNSNVETISKGNTNWVYTYDEHDSPETEVLTVDGVSFNIAYLYDQKDALSQVTYPSGLVVDFAPNELGWPTQAGSFASSVNYFDNGQMQSILFGNGVLSTLTQSPRLFPERITTGAIIDRTYSYDDKGNPTSIFDHLGGEQSVTQMTYDGLDRFTSANGPWGSSDVSYDALGNITQKTAGGITYSYTYLSSNNRLASVAGGRNESFLYDLYGNLTTNQSGTRAHTYDHASNLVESADGLRYEYDGNGRLVTKNENVAFGNGQRRHSISVYNKSGYLMAEYDFELCRTRDYVRLGPLLIAVNDTESTDDSDADGVPDCVEFYQALNPSDPADGAADADSDGLSNADEVTQGSDLRNPDTDRDGMPDGYEVANGFSPTSFDALGDADLDGVENYVEYREGTDPNDAGSTPPAAANGFVVWQIALVNMVGDPVISDDQILHVGTQDGLLYAFYSVGLEKWQVDVGKEITTRAAVGVDGTVYVGAEDTLQAYDQEGTQVFAHAFAANISAAPAVQDDGTVYFGTDDGLLHQINPDGSLVTVDNLGQPINNQPVINTDGNLIVGGSDGVVREVDPNGGVTRSRTGFGSVIRIGVVPGGSYVANSGGQSRSIRFGSPSDDFVWRRGTGTGFPTIGVIGHVNTGLVTVTSSFRFVYNSLDDNGDFDQFGQDPLAMAFGRTVRSTSNGQIGSFDSDGLLRWSQTIADQVEGTPIIGRDGTLYVRGTDGGIEYLIAVGNDTPGDRRIPWAREGGDQRGSGQAPRCDGSVDTDADGMNDCLEDLYGFDPNDPSDAALDADGDGLSNVDEIIGGTSPRNEDTDGDYMPDGYEVAQGLDATLDDSELDFDNDGAQNLPEYFSGTDANDAASTPAFAPSQLLWSLELADHNAVEQVKPSVAHNGNVVVNVNNEVRILSPLGTVQRVIDFGLAATVRPVGIDGDGNIIANVVNPNGLSGVFTFKLDGLGDEIWSVQIDFSSDISPPGIGADNSIYVLTEGSGYALDASNGTVLWTSSVAGFSPIEAPVLDAQGNVFFTGSAEVVGYSQAGSEVSYLPVWEEINVGRPTIDGSDQLKVVTQIEPFGFMQQVYLLSFDPLSGEEEPFWTYDSNAADFPAPGVVVQSDGTSVIADYNGNLHAVNPDGTGSWVQRIDDFVNSACGGAELAIGANDEILVTQDCGEENDSGLFVLSSDGEQIWKRDRIQTGFGLNVFPHTVDDNGIIYYAQTTLDETRLFAVQGFSTGQPSSAWPQMGQDAQNTYSTGAAAPNPPPVVTISQPIDGAEFVGGTSITFTATAVDDIDGDISASISWTSDVDGALGSGASISATLSVGAHIISAQTTDSGGSTGNQSINVSVVAPNAAPVVTISAPSTGNTFTSTDVILFSGTSNDAEDGDLTAAIVWSSSLDGPLGTGSSVNATLSIGTHTITASSTDSEPEVGTAVISIAVTAPPNTPPVVAIIGPSDGSSFTTADSIALSGTSNDVENGDLSANIVWTSDIDGALGSGATVNTSLSVGSHVVTASSSDGELTGSDSITIVITALNSPPSVVVTTPTTGSAFSTADSITFAATAVDAEDGDISGALNWTSSIDGSIGSGGSFSAVLSQGTHTVDAAVTDLGGLNASFQLVVTVSVANDTPVVAIASPADGSVYSFVETIFIAGTSNDSEDGDLSSGIAWSSNVDGALGVGSAITTQLSEGPHTLTASSTDTSGLIGSSTVNVVVNSSASPREAGAMGCQALNTSPLCFNSGNIFLSSSDYLGTGPFPLEWRRAYNSRDGVWRFSYSQRLEFSTAVETVLWHDDGQAISFYATATGWEPLSDVTTQLTYDETASEWTVTYDDDTIERFASNGQLIAITNNAGQSISITYSAGLATAINHYSGRSLTLTYDVNNLIQSMTDSGGNEVGYTYDTNGMLELVSLPDGTPANSTDNPQRRYHYEHASHADLVTGITDENGVRYATYGYNGDRAATSSALIGGVESTSVVYGSNNTATVTNALARQLVYTLVANNSMRSVVQIDGQATSLVDTSVSSYTYDANGFVDTHTDENGNVTEYTYNSRGLVESETQAFGTPEARTTTTTWHAALRVPTQIVRPGQTVDMTYDSAGRLLTRTVTDTQTQTVPYSTNGNTRVWTYTYHPTFGLVTSIDGPRTGDTTTYTYDVNGDLATTTNAEGHVTTIVSRDARGLPTRIEDANGVDTVMVYDERGRLTSRTVESSQGNAVTSFAYDDASQLTSVTLPNLSALNYEYDDAHRLVAIENNLGERIEYTLDNAGNRTGEVIRDGSANIVRTMTRLFDELSRLREDIGAQTQTTSFDYDDNDNLSDVEDALLNTTTQSFDALDRLITVTDPLLNDANYGYDDRDNLTQVTDPRGIITTFVYDGLNNLIQEASADAGTSVHLYDAAGNRTQTTDARGVVSQFAYDGLSRLITVTYPASTAENITYTYDTGTNSIGRLSSIADGSGSTAYTYDDRGNVLTEVRTVGSASYTTSYAYDLAENLTLTTYPSGRIVTYARDTLGRVSSVSTQTDAGSAAESVASGITYLPYGPSTGWTYGNGSVAVRAFDQDFRMTDLQVTTSGSAGQLDRDYLYNAVHNITSISNVIDTSRTQTFDYDVLYRLTDATGIYGTYEFEYDEVGNRTVQTIDSTQVLNYTYFPTSNRLSTVNDAGDLRVFTYDAAGNIILDDRGSGPDITFEYNDRNRLVEVEVAP